MMYLYSYGTTLVERRQIMREPFDEYIDQFGIGAGVYGVALNFMKTSPKPVAPGNVPPTEDIGTIRMSLEHFKIMTFLMKRHVDGIESQLGIDIPFPIQVMNALKIAPEDWQHFWQKPK